MAATGTIAPRVVVRPPNVPAPPPISLLTQNNVDDSDATVLAEDSNPRWEGGGGSIWLDPLKEFRNNQVWQSWPDGAGTAQTNKSSLSDGSDPGVPSGPGAADQAPIQRPIVASLIIKEGLLTEWALRSSIEGDIGYQLGRALDAVMPRVIERELWSSAEVALANWASQFRLKTPNVVSNVGTAAVPFGRALALAEQAAADNGFLDLYGGAFIHASVGLFSLIAGINTNLVRSPSGRQVTTLAGCQLIPEVGAPGSWSEATTSFVQARPGGSPVGDNIANGWLFVTPPIRVRLGRDLIRVLDASPDNTNNRTLLVERAFLLEASVVSGHFTSIAVPVDYTTSGV